MVKEIADEKAAHLIGGIATPSQQTSEFGSAAPAQVRVAKEEVEAAAEQWQPCPAGFSVAPRKLGDSSTEVERAVVEAAVHTDVASPALEPPGAKDKTHPTHHHPIKPMLSKLVRRDSGCCKKMPAAAAAHLADQEHENGDGRYRDEYWHSEDRGGGGEESENQGFEFGGEQEQEHTGASETPEKKKHNKEGRQEAGEGFAQETKKDEKGEAEKEGAASGGKTTNSVPSCDNRSSQHIAQDTLAESSTRAGGVAQVWVEPPLVEKVQHASAVAVSQQRYCPEEVKQERIQAPPSALVPAASSKELTSNTRMVGSITESQSGTVPRTAAMSEPNGEIGIQAAPGYVRRPSYMPGQAMRPARSAARASIQLSLPPVIAEAGTESTCAASNANAIKTAHAAVEVEPEESDQPENQSWAEYYALNDRRQHSTPNLVSFRRNPRRQSVELFEHDDSDDTSTSSRSSGAIGGEDAIVQERPNEVDDHVSWQQTEEGKSRMAQLTKATVAVESPATKMSRKYLKLFAPSNSVRFVIFFVFRTWNFSFIERTTFQVTQSLTRFSLAYPRALKLLCPTRPILVSRVLTLYLLHWVGHTKKPALREKRFRGILLWCENRFARRQLGAKPTMQHKSSDSTVVAFPS